MKLKLLNSLIIDIIIETARIKFTMNSLKLNISKLISLGSKLSRGNTKLQNGQRILMYHSVRTLKPDQALKDIYVLDPLLFKKQMEFLKDHFEGQIQKIDPKSSNKDLLPFSINVTFDDGFKDNLTEVAPIMDAIEIPYTVFIATDFLNSDYPLHLDKRELQELASRPNVTIGSHSTSHANLTHLTEKKIRLEVKESKTRLEDIIGQDVHGFSYPFGAVDKRIRDIVEESGYLYAVNSCFNINNKNSDQFMLNRNEIWNTDTIQTFQEKIHGNWDWLRLNHKFKF